MLEIRGIGNSFIHIVKRIVKIWHDDAGYIDSNGKRFFNLTTAITANVTPVPTLAIAGSEGRTTHNTGKNQVFTSDGVHWQLLLRASSVMCGQAYLGAVPTATTTGGATQKDLNGATAGATLASIVQPKTPRNLTVTFTDGNASISAFTLRAAGKAPDGTSITEDFVFAGGLVQVGSKVFASVTSWTIVAITGNGASDTLDVGYGAKLGVPVPYGAQNLVITNLLSNGTEEAAAATDQTNNSFTPTTAPDGTKTFTVWFGYAFPA